MNNHKDYITLGDKIFYLILSLVIIFLVLISTWQIDQSSAMLQEEKTIFAVQNRLQGYFLNQFSKYQKIKFGEVSPFKNLPSRDELVNLVTFLELIDKKTGNLASIEVVEAEGIQDGYPFPAVLYTINLTKSLNDFNHYLSFLETLPYYYIINQSSWRSLSDEEVEKGLNQGKIELLIFIKDLTS